MITEENASILKDWADAARDLERRHHEAVKGRDAAIRGALKLGAGVAEIVRLAGVTRARVYQIRDGR